MNGIINPGTSLLEPITASIFRPLNIPRRPLRQGTRSSSLTQIDGS